MHVLGKDENVSAVVASGAVVPLLNTLELPRDRPAMEAIQERRKLLEATTRALKAIFASSRAIKYDTFTVSFDLQEIYRVTFIHKFYRRKNTFMIWYYCWIQPLRFLPEKRKEIFRVKGYLLP